MLKECKSYAKINLNLHIVNKTKKGYHKLKMLMTLVDYYDLVTFEECDDIIVEVKEANIDMKDNLCYKIAKYLYNFSKKDKGIKISINKNIPLGGGLGGGSSNAAVVLNFLNTYWGLNFSVRKIKKIGFKFGCDIPFFIEGKSAIVSGFGEKIRFTKVEERNIILIIPSFSLSTKEVFFQYDKIVKDKASKKRYDATLKYNALEVAANSLCNNQITKIKDKVIGKVKGDLLMTGSGSTIVYYLDDFENVDEVMTLFEEKIQDCKFVISKTKANYC